jgi:hypothetical protein
LITKEDIWDLCSSAYHAGLEFDPKRIELINWKKGLANHIPSQLPDGKMAIYIFFLGEESLKVGKAGEASSARYQSHHYGYGRSKSSLANSLVNDLYFPLVQKENVGEWMREYTNRSNILIPSKLGLNFLNFAEAFFILKYNPRYES